MCLSEIGIAKSAVVTYPCALVSAQLVEHMTVPMAWEAVADTAIASQMRGAEGTPVAMELSTTVILLGACMERMKRRFKYA